MNAVRKVISGDTKTRATVRSRLISPLMRPLFPGSTKNSKLPITDERDSPQPPANNPGTRPELLAALRRVYYGKNHGPRNNTRTCCSPTHRRVLKPP